MLSRLPVPLEETLKPLAGKAAQNYGAPSFLPLKTPFLLISH